MFYSSGLKFGFEFEFTGISREAAFRVLCKVLERYYPGPELSSCEISDQDFSIYFPDGLGWKIVRDI